MAMILSDRRLGLKSVLHDRRRKQLVEELLDAMRLQAAESREQSKKQAANRRLFWLALGIIAFAFIFVALVAEQANHSFEPVNKATNLIALYQWLGFYRVAPTF